MTKWYILDGHETKPVDSLEEWSNKMQMDRHVAQDVIGDIRISTVFLGLDHNHFDGPPILFETMIFGGQHDEYQARCSTWEQAVEQHAGAVALVRVTLN